MARRLPPKHIGTLKGIFGIQLTKPANIQPKHLASVMKTIKQRYRMFVGHWPGPKIHCFIYPDAPVTRKPRETRMGKGKGAVVYCVSPCRVGTFVLGLRNRELDEKVTKLILQPCLAKLPGNPRIVYHDFEKDAIHPKVKKEWRMPRPFFPWKQKMATPRGWKGLGA